MFEFLEKKKIYLVYLPLAVYWLILFVLTSLPAKSLPKVEIGDKFEHLGAFFVLAILLSLALYYQNKNIFLKKNFLAASIVIASFYGVLDELHQYYIPGRYTEFLDWFADTLGAVIGVLLVRYLLNKFNYVSS